MLFIGHSITFLRCFSKDTQDPRECFGHRKIYSGVHVVGAWTVITFLAFVVNKKFWNLVKIVFIYPFIPQNGFQVQIQHFVFPLLLNYVNKQIKSWWLLLLLSCFVYIYVMALCSKKQNVEFEPENHFGECRDI